MTKKLTLTLLTLKTFIIIAFLISCNPVNPSNNDILYVGETSIVQAPKMKETETFEQDEVNQIEETPTIFISQKPSLTPDEVEIFEIKLPSPIDKPNAEISGMDWFDDKLVLLPQYPERFSVDGIGSLFFINKADILDYLDNKKTEKINIYRIPFHDESIRPFLDGFEGYESIVFYGDKFFVTIETRPGETMMGFIAGGRVEGDLGELTLNSELIYSLPPQNNYSNASDEAMLIYNDRIYTIFEDNGKFHNENPHAHVFDTDLITIGITEMPQIEFRITDASAVDSEGNFWVINYFFPGDIHLLPAIDPIAVKYGEGPTHKIFEPVERLLQLRISNNTITLVDNEPIQLTLLPDNEARNWEGLVKLDDRGFLLATDKFPESILAFVKFLRLND